MNSRVVLLLCAIVLALCAVTAFVIYHALPDWQTRASFGEMFGAISALFSGLAFAGVVAALLMQRTELALQREELRLSREQQIASTQAQIESSHALNRQFQIQTLAARATALHITVLDLSATLDRASAVVIDARQAGVVGVSTERFAPGAATRLEEARKQLAQLISEIDILVTSQHETKEQGEENK